MKVDKVVALCKGAMCGKNLYCSIEIAKTCNVVKGVSTEFLDHHDSACPFFIGWKTI